jgi:hypothetical protein
MNDHARDRNGGNLGKGLWKGINDEAVIAKHLHPARRRSVASGRSSHDRSAPIEGDKFLAALAPAGAHKRGADAR